MRNINNPTVTIAIATYNAELNIRRMLESLVDQKEINFKIIEILVSDDSSSDNTIKIDKEFKAIKLEYSDQNPGEGSALT